MQLACVRPVVLPRCPPMPEAILKVPRVFLNHIKLKSQEITLDVNVNKQIDSFEVLYLKFSDFCVK